MWRAEIDRDGRERGGLIELRFCFSKRRTACNRWREGWEEKPVVHITPTNPESKLSWSEILRMLSINTEPSLHFPCYTVRSQGRSIVPQPDQMLLMRAGGLLRSDQYRAPWSGGIRECTRYPTIGYTPLPWPSHHSWARVCSLRLPHHKPAEESLVVSKKP